VGATKRPSYRVVAIDRRRPRDGRALEILGFYDPLTEPATVRLETEKIKAWIGKGAQPSEMVTRLLRQAEAATSAPAAAPKKPASKGRTVRKPKATPTPPPAPAEDVAATDAGAAGGTDVAAAEPEAAADTTDATETPVAEAGAAEDEAPPAETESAEA
jgi:small subunit ribosomal protein S16